MATMLSLIGVVAGYVLGGIAFEWWSYRRRNRWTEEGAALSREIAVASREFHEHLHT